jgi:Protein of unknown function (DUF1800)
MTPRLFKIASTIGCLILPTAGAAIAAPATQADALHVLNRLAFGPRPGDIERVMNMGIDSFIDQQLHPETIPMPPELSERLAKLSAGEMPQADLITTYRVVREEPPKGLIWNRKTTGFANRICRKLGVEMGFPCESDS